MIKHGLNVKLAIVKKLENKLKVKEIGQIDSACQNKLFSVETEAMFTATEVFRSF